MAVDEDGWQAGVDDTLAIDDGVARRGHDLDVVGARLAEVVGHGFRTAHDIPGVGGIGTDGGDAEQVEEFVEEAVLVLGEVILWRHACKVATSGGSVNANKAKEEGRPPFGSRPRFKWTSSEDVAWASALGREDQVAAAVGEFNANQLGAVGQGRDELDVSVDGLFHGAEVLRLA